MRDDRITALRELESSCYGVCLFMLGEETGAAQAAQHALKDLYGDEKFWLMTAEERERRMCRLSAARALERRTKT